MKDSEVYKKYIKKISGKLSLNQIKRLSDNELPKNVTKEEAKAMFDLSHTLFNLNTGKSEFTAKEFAPYINQAYVWICFELFIRLGASEFDIKTGNLKHTKKGKNILKLIKCN